MELLDLTVACPRCHSANVVYSCEPTCCFNHVCGDCLTSFQLLTNDLGGELPIESTDLGDRDLTAPTAACARCQSLDLYAVITDGSTARQFVCASCRARLELIVSIEGPE